MVQLSALSMAALSVFSLATVGAGVSYAAKDAEPGDLLYPVHTSVYGDAETDAEANIDAAANASTKASNLKAEGKLTADVRAKLAEKFDAQVAAAQEKIATLEANNDAQAAARLRAMLNLQVRSAVGLFREEGSSSSMSSASSPTEASASSVGESSASSNSISSESDDDDNVDVDLDADASAEVEVR